MNKRLLSEILFFGALWGIIEATLGYVLHLVPVPFLAGTIMFPIAVAILLQAHRRTDSRQAVFAIGVVAASIKSVNFLTPMNQWGIINPMIAIVLETLLVVAAVHLLTDERVRTSLAAFFGVSLGWRLLYTGWFTIQLIATGFLAEQIAAISTFTLFVVIHGAISAFAAFGLHKGLSRVRITRFDIHPIAASATLVLAVALTFVL